MSVHSSSPRRSVIPVEMSAATQYLAMKVTVMTVCSGAETPKEKSSHSEAEETDPHDWRERIQ